MILEEKVGKIYQKVGLEEELDLLAPVIRVAMSMFKNKKGEHIEITLLAYEFRRKIRNLNKFKIKTKFILEKKVEMHKKIISLNNFMILSGACSRAHVQPTNP